MFQLRMDFVQLVVAEMAFVVDKWGCFAYLVVVIVGVDGVYLLKELALSCLHLFSVDEVAVLLCFFEIFDFDLQFVQEVSLLHQWAEFYLLYSQIQIGQSLDLGQITGVNQHFVLHLLKFLMNFDINLGIFDHQPKHIEMVEDVLIKLTFLCSNFNRNSSHKGAFVVFKIVDNLLFEIKMRQVSHNKILTIVQFRLAKIDGLVNLFNLSTHMVIIVTFIHLLLNFLFVLFVKIIKRLQQNEFPFDSCIDLFNCIFQILPSIEKYVN